MQINYPGSGNNTQLMYDGLRRNAKIVENFGGSSTSTLQFVWCNSIRCEERNSSGALLKQFFEAGQRNSSTSYFYTRDHLKSIQELTDSSGIIQGQYQFEPYGRTVKIQGGSDSDLGFTSFYRHQRSGLSLTPTRSYMCDFGRWLTRDPFQDPTFHLMPQSPENLRTLTRSTVAHQASPHSASPGRKSLRELNPYAYVVNNPILWTDPSGMSINVPAWCLVFPWWPGCKPKCKKEENDCYADCNDWYLIDVKWCDDNYEHGSYEHIECLKDAEETRDQCVQDCMDKEETK